MRYHRRIRWQPLVHRGLGRPQWSDYSFLPRQCGDLGPTARNQKRGKRIPNRIDPGPSGSLGGHLRGTGALPKSEATRGMGSQVGRKVRSGQGHTVCRVPSSLDWPSRFTRSRREHPGGSTPAGTGLGRLSSGHPPQSFPLDDLSGATNPYRHRFQKDSPPPRPPGQMTTMVGPYEDIKKSPLPGAFSVSR